MGCDGGTIPRRDELVKIKKKPETKDKDSELIYKWRYCSITQQLLQPPIVMCGLGKLYNKVALIEVLINKETMPECAEHIKNLKDVKDLHLSKNPVYKGDEQKNGSNSRTAPYICPVIGLEMSGKFRFVALWTCGCVFSERAYKEINTKTCHKCQKPFDDNDVVVLNGNEEDLVLMKQRMELRQKTKKIKNKIKKENTDEPSPSTSGTPESVKIKQEPTDTPKKEKTDTNQMKNGCLKRENSGKTEYTKKMKLDYSVAKDPKVTDVYKSIFTTHKSEKEQNRAHWITYNPFYN